MYRFHVGNGFWWKGRYYPAIGGGSDDGDDSGGEGGESNDGKQNDGDSGDKGDKSGDGDEEAKRRGDIAKALDAERAETRKLKKKLEEKERAEREATEREAQQKGEYEKLYNELKSKTETEIGELRAELFRRDAERALLSYLGEKHPSHVSKVRWLLPILSTELKSDMDEDTVSATVKRVADDYVKDHPISDASSGGAPGSGGSRKGDNAPRDPLAKFGGLKDMMDTMMPANSGHGGK